MGRAIVAFVAITWVLFGARAEAARYYVKGSVGASGSGLNWGEAKKTVQEAVDLTTNTDEVWVAAGTYTADGTNTLVVMKSGVSIYGGFGGTETSLSQRDIAANPTILDGANRADHVVSAAYVATAELSGFTIQHGHDSGTTSGGGVYAYKCHALTISDCTVRNNFSKNGGGMYIRQSSDTLVVDSRISNNFAWNLVGGVYFSSSTGTVSGCTVNGNTHSGIYFANGSGTVLDCTLYGNFGAGVFVANSTATLSDCTMAGNTGTGIMISNPISGSPISSSATITDCVISANTSVMGGGIGLASGTTAIVANCVISGNYVQTSGGGIYNEMGTLQLLNCTVDSNDAFMDGGGYWGASFGSESDTIANCIFSNNIGGGIFSDHMTSPTLSYSLFYMNMSSRGGPADYTFYDSGTSYVINGASNIDSQGLGSFDRDGDPAYDTSSAASGTWTADPVFDSATSSTLLTSSSANLEVNALAGKLLIPNTSMPYQFFVISNTQTTITVSGNATMLATNGARWRIANYQLTAGSAAIDVGCAIGGITSDIAGTPRPSGSGYDIGAYEYVSGPSGPMDIVWLDFPWSGAKMGTEAQPFSNIDDALTWVTTGGTIKIKPGSAAISKRVIKNVRIEAPSGGVRIGSN